jgi:hypothetical protein
MDKVQKHNSFNLHGIFIVVSIYFIIYSVWKLLDTPSYLYMYLCGNMYNFHMRILSGRRAGGWAGGEAGRQAGGEAGRRGGRQALLLR